MNAPVSALRGGARCPDCGASLTTTIAGLCGACLMRLASGEYPAADEDAAALPAFDAWLALKGQRIGNYQLLDEIARGGMGIVYRARQVAAGRIVALKILLPQLSTQARMKERFAREVEAVAQLDHPGILPIYEVGEHAGLPLFSMKFAEGGGLDQRLDSLAGHWREIATLVAQIAAAVDHANRCGILHRDLKPANILFDGHDAPMVADFGLAKFRASESGLTIPTSSLGSPNYMAPEQVSAAFGEFGPHTDVYGLGAILYQLLTGRPPVQGEDALATLRLVPTFQPPAAREIRPDVPADLAAIAHQCLQKQPELRYTTAAEVASDLNRWLDGSGVLAARIVRVRAAQRWMRRAAAGIAIVAVIAAAWWFARPLVASQTPAAASARSTAALPSAGRPRSIGVVPFLNLSGLQDDNYLSSIVTDDLLRELRQVDSLSVLPFRVGVDPAKQFDPEALSASLGVDMLLAGEFERSSDVIKVRASLWDARSHRKVWQHGFETPDGDLREMRSKIASALVTGLQIEVGDDLRAQLAANALTGNEDAYRKYLRARYLLRWRRPETLVEAARQLRQAVALDPDFAHAHSALSYVYALWVPPAPPEGNHWDLAIQFAKSALALDPALAEPHAVLGDYFTFVGNYPQAELEFREAMRLGPRDPAALHLYAIQMFGVGRLKEALALEQRSVALDASSPQPMMWLAMLTTLRGDRDEALRLWQKSDEMGAAHPLMAAVVRLELGQSEYLAEWYRTSFAQFGVPPQLRDYTALLAGVLDPAKRDSALAWLHAVERQVDPAFAITHYAMLGATEDAFRLTQRYELDDDTWYLYKLVNIWSPRTSAMRSDPRFGELMRRWGFADFWRKFGHSELCAMSETAIQCR
jgi:TolB-like protein